MPTRLDDQAPRFADVKKWFFSKWTGARVWLVWQEDLGVKKRQISSVRVFCLEGGWKFRHFFWVNILCIFRVTKRVLRYLQIL